MRWLLLKDLQILRRSPLLVSLLVVYPALIAVLVGAALSRGPDNPAIALYNEVPAEQRTFDVGGAQVNADEYLPQLTSAVDVIEADTREEALALAADGTVLAAVILPPDIADRLATGRQQATIEIAYNGEDPVKQRYVESVVKARMADANDALAKKYEEITLGYIDMLLDGGTLTVLGRDVQILGLRNARSILQGVMGSLPEDGSSRAALEQIERFATLAIENLGVSADVLRSVGEPIAVRETVLGGRRTPLDRYAVAVAASVSLLFLTVLLASGLLALEREEHAFARLVRGLVSPLGLLVEKAALAAAVAVAVALALLVALGLFWVGLDFARAPLWLPALALGAAAFAGLGVAVGALAREVRAASLLAFTLALPIAFLALIPGGAVSGWLSAVVDAVCAVFPFKATVAALDVAVNDAPGGIAVPLAHLAVLAVAYIALARMAVRRFS